VSLADYEIVIGLEVHAELKTDAKVFCGCSTRFGGDPNSQVCPVCLGLPGALPVLNEKALEYTILAGLALNCEIAEYSKFDRKQYFYPDSPKAYQISQYDLPFCKKGWIEIPADNAAPGMVKKVGITRVHLEEEAGKLVHSGTGIMDSSHSFADYNRCGIPLIEIVGEPDLRSPKEARDYLEKLRTLLLYTGVSDCKMEEGSLRCDANISLRPKGEQKFGVLAEIKNINSFRSVQAALEYEAKRQAKLLDAGEKMIKQTRGWDDTKGVTAFMRSKEEASDYRYFPEPDLLPVTVKNDRVEQLRKRLPEMPDTRRQRYIEKWGLPAYDADLISSSREMADYFEAVVAAYNQPKIAGNWMMGELSRLLNQERLEFGSLKIKPAALAKMLSLIDAGTISGKIAKAVFEEMFFTGKDPETIVQEKGLIQISDTSELEAMARRIIEANPQSVADFLAGKEQALKFLIGQMMRESKGRANPGIVNDLLKKELAKKMIQ
jgi:aspartyl-tRNA(Asn)/glutamyl-tRNA(Gln) amidotransferase subunit B